MRTTIFSSAQAKADVGADVAWQQMKNFGDLSWAEGIDEVKLVSEGISQLRKVRLSGSDDWINERLLALDERGKTLRYGMDDEAMAGLMGYEAQAHVLNRSNGCLIRWQCQADAEIDQRTDVQAVLDLIAEGIAGLFAAQFEAGNREPDHGSA